MHEGMLMKTIEQSASNHGQSSLCVHYIPIRLLCKNRNVLSNALLLNKIETS